MRKSRFTESQIVAVLKEAESGVFVNEVCRKHGISDATYYNWKSKYGGMEISDLRRMKELEAENLKLKHLYADMAREDRALKDSTILVTGALGFVGRNLCSLLAGTTACKMIVGAGRCDAPGVSDESTSGVRHVKIDLLDRKSVSDLLDGLRPDYVFHLAGALSAKDWISHYNGNVEPTINILDAIRHLGLKTRVVVPGSAAEYGRISKEDLPVMESQSLNPVSPYGVAKVWQTTVARYFASTGVDAVIGRIFNIIGKGAPSGLSIGSFASQIGMIKKRQMEPVIRVGNLAPKRDFIDIKDACAGLVALAQKGETGTVYNICSGQSVSMQDVLRMMIERTMLDIEVSVDPSRFKDADIDDIYGSNEKIREETGWEPVIPLSASIDGIVGGL